MKGMVIDPRGRLKRRWFIYDLILPNIGAVIAILAIRILDLGMVGDLAIGGIAALLLWSANFAAPMSRLHDLGAPGWIHLVVVVVVFLLSTIGPVSGPGEAVIRAGDWLSVVRGNDSQVPPVSAEFAQIGATIGAIQFLVLAFWPGQEGANRFGPDPRGEKDS
ncbi:DUF805 domain-containing protein [Parvularcula lutaonensis]|uniref:DUF805 domain-containing protein n=1 Tax=Parvularcula lutaonensis TaxID=491923 RepID=A0ABV7M843_9PROT|nr:DUF805 domain-containing protein [Parvularcula lutaonensis]GGY41820.1 hypothetical protein GCM10007148_08050 [Parvularcula lutaonensis]